MRFPLSRRNGSAHTADRVGASYRREGEGIDYYDGVVIGVGTIGERAVDPATARAALGTLEGLEEDDYLSYLRGFVETGRRLGGERWRYADIVTALFAAAELLEPDSYLEIGVRRGRSMATVASRAPRCTIVGVDMWQEDYGGMANPGPDHVRGELEKVGYEGEVEFVSGNSHEVLPRLFRERPELSFDLITVDGDHTRRGARRDLLDVLPRLRVGGALVLDDTRHPAHPGLHDVWERTVAADRRYATWEFDEVGYGVALAVRRW